MVVGLNRVINEREHWLLYDIDHATLGEQMRDFASKQRWAAPSESKSEVVDLNSLPPCLGLLKPSGVYVYDDRVELEFGAAFSHFGMVAFRPGLSGSGGKRLAQGLWFYSDDGRIPPP
jgi:hypothetical protein